MQSLSKTENGDVIDYDKTPFVEVLPVEAGEKMSALHKTKMMSTMQNKEADAKHAAKSMHPNGLDIPVYIFKKYCKALKSQKPALVDKFLHSLGVEVSNKHSRVSWEVFL